MTQHPATLHGAIEWAVESAGLPAGRVKPEHVRVFLTDGREFLLQDALKDTPTDWKLTDITRLSIKHPDAEELIELLLTAPASYESTRTQAQEMAKIPFADHEIRAALDDLTQGEREEFWMCYVASVLGMMRASLKTNESFTRAWRIIVQADQIHRRIP